MNIQLYKISDIWKISYKKNNESICFCFVLILINYIFIIPVYFSQYFFKPTHKRLWPIERFSAILLFLFNFFWFHFAAKDSEQHKYRYIFTAKRELLPGELAFHWIHFDLVDLTMRKVSVSVSVSEAVTVCICICVSCRCWAFHFIAFHLNLVAVVGWLMMKVWPKFWGHLQDSSVFWAAVAIYYK